MPYADTDFFLALGKEDDWLSARAETLLHHHAGELRTGLPTFIEIAYNAEEYEIDLQAAATSILEIVTFDGDADRVFEAYGYIEEELGVMDAFHAAWAGDGPMISSDQAVEDVGIERVALEPDK